MKKQMDHVVISTPQGEVTILRSQARIYARKSTAGDRAMCSIEEQVKGARRFCERLGIPIRDEDILEERPGMKGHYYWEGGGPSWDLDGKPRKTRPELTKLVRDIQAGRVRLVAVWDLSRLWRHTGVCSDLIELLAEKGVLLADRHSFQDISSPEGRKRVSDNAAMYQEVREMISENTKRSFASKRERGEAIALGHFLGYRRVSKRTVEHVPTEIALVRRIYTMFVHGENGRAPMSVNSIARQLRDEGQIVHFPPARSKNAIKPEDRLIYSKTVGKVLASPRYIAKQWLVDSKATKEARLTKPFSTEVKTLVDALEFLIEGEPAVDPLVWQAARAKLERHRNLGRRSISGRPGSGTLRCGICAKAFTLSKGPKRDSTHGQAIPALSAWRANRTFSYHSCNHNRCAISHLALMRFFRDDMSKVLKAELRRAHARSSAADIDNKISEMRIQRGRILGYLQQCSEDSLDNLIAGRAVASSELVERAKDRLFEIDARLLELRDQSEKGAKTAALLDGWDQEDEDKVRESIRSAIVWGAVVPLPASEELKSSVKGSYAVGHVLFLTSWHTYHTAVIERRVIPGRTIRARRTNVLRLLPADEGLGTVMNLPDPKRFYENLVREQGYRRTRGPFRVENWAPGYISTDEMSESIESLLSIDLKG